MTKPPLTHSPPSRPVREATRLPQAGRGTSRNHPRTERNPRFEATGTAQQRIWAVQASDKGQRHVLQLALLKMGAEGSLEPSSSAPSLPSGFLTIEGIQSIPSEKVKAGTMVNLIGFVKDYQPPIPTRGTGTLSSLRSHTGYTNGLARL
jgi:hypothetical protein